MEGGRTEADQRLLVTCRQEKEFWTVTDNDVCASNAERKDRKCFHQKEMVDI